MQMRLSALSAETCEMAKTTALNNLNVMHMYTYIHTYLNPPTSIIIIIVKKENKCNKIGK